MKDIIKCNNCHHVLIQGSSGASCCFVKGTSITCRKCGSKYTFGQEQEKIENKTVSGH